MLITVASYRKGTNAAHVMYNPQTRRIHIMHENKNGVSQFPCQYDDGQIVYDFIPVKYIRPAIEKAFRCKKAFEFAQKYPGWHTFDKGESDVIHDLQSANLVAVYEAGNQFRII